MNIADRIQSLRKLKGVSQEELADIIGVSRQSVSKWESEQSVPDLDKVIIMSDYFDVSTDYLLRGIESQSQTEKKEDANIFAMVGTVLNFIGLVIACAIWYEEQVMLGAVVGLVFMALGCMVFFVGLYGAEPRTRGRGKKNFLTANVWILLFMPLSLGYNAVFSGHLAPYPLLVQPLLALPIFWGIYAAICLVAVLLGRRYFSGK